MHNVVLLKLCLDNDQWASLDELNVNPRKDVMVGYRLQLLKARAVVKSTFVKSKTSPSPKRFESESRPSPKRFESESSPSPKWFETESKVVRVRVKTESKEVRVQVKSKSKWDGQNRERKKISSSKPHT